MRKCTAFSLLAALVVTAFAVIAMGCNRSGARLREAASVDLHCPASQLRFKGSGKSKYVEGCGRNATYVYDDGYWEMATRDGAPVGRPGQPAPTASSAVPTSRPAPQPQPVLTATGTPSMPPPSLPPPSPPPAAPGQKSL